MRENVMAEVEARIATLDSSGLLQALAMGWVHRYPVRYDTLTAEVAIDGCEFVMTADGDSLTLRIAGSTTEAVELVQRAVELHLDRAGVDRGPFHYDWFTH